MNTSIHKSHGRVFIKRRLTMSGLFAWTDNWFSLVLRCWRSGNMAAVKTWHKHMLRLQTLSCAAHSVCVRCYRWEKEDIGLSTWHDVIVSVLKPVYMSFSCVCMKEPVKQSVLVSVWQNHHLPQPGESRLIDKLPSLTHTLPRARSCAVIGRNDSTIWPSARSVGNLLFTR